MADVRSTQAIFSAMLESRAGKKAERAARKVESKKLMKEDTGAAMFTGRLLKESEEDVVEDILDNIVVVTDPDKTADDLETRADDIQDAIEGSPEGEAAFTDEYVGDKVYACPICGESFFAEDEYNEGDMCPICKAEPDKGFLLQGVVTSIEAEEEELVAEEPEAEEIEVPEEGLEEPEVEEAEEGEVTEEPETEDDEEDVVIADDEDDAANESYIKEGKECEEPEEEPVVEGKLNLDIAKAKANILDAMVSKRPSNADEYENMVKSISVYELKKAGEKGKVDFDNIRSAYPSQIGIIVVDSADNQAEIPCNVEKKIATECDQPAVEIEIEVNAPVAEPTPAEVEGVELDEESFNTCLNAFAEENYSDCLDDLSVVDAVYSPEEDTLRIECKATTKDNQTADVKFDLKEIECKENKAVLAATEATGVFKIESKKPAFEFTVVQKDGFVVCESMKYGYTTTHSTAGKVKVEGVCKSGKVIVE